MPALSLRSLGLRGNHEFRHIAASRPVEKFRSGRLALMHALGLCGVGPGSEVLVPAYHCQSMVDPIESLGGRAVFYRISKVLMPDIEDIERKLSRKTKAVLAVHFFGIKADLCGLRSLCDRFGANLIEDCAHCFSYYQTNPGYGQTGDYVITSPRKFLPIFDGGELFSPNQSLPDITHQLTSVRYQLKILANTIERSRTSHGSNVLVPDSEPASPAVDTQNPNDEDKIEYVDPRFDFTQVNSRPSISGMALTNILSLRRASLLRRQNFGRLDAVSQSFRLASKIITQFENGGTPYVFPLLVSESGDIHSRLKRKGIPMWRWDDLRTSDCQFSQAYGRNLIQLPCHQELSTQDLDQIIEALLSVLG